VIDDSRLSRRAQSRGVSSAERWPPGRSRRAGRDGPNRAIRIADGRLGIRAGHSTENQTGRPAARRSFFDAAAAAGIDYDGLSPRRIAGRAASAGRPVERIHGIFLDRRRRAPHCRRPAVSCASEEREGRFRLGHPDPRIPIVVSAVIDDLAVATSYSR
jgi:hypothetical protein